MTNFIRNIVRKTGFDLVRYPYRDRASEFAYNQMLEAQNIDLIFDIGANVGQYATETYEMGFAGTIVSFEPMSKEYATLLQTKKDSGIKDWIVAPQAAIGNLDGEIVINISANSVSSSIMDLTDYTKQNAAPAKYIGSEKVPVHKLNTVGPNYIKDFNNPFIKLDVQGYEEDALKVQKELWIWLKECIWNFLW